MDDSKIIALYWQRDPEAVAATSQKYGPYCFTIAQNILHSREDSEECVNDTWLQAWTSMPPHKPNKLCMFLAKITRNLSINRYKAKTAEKRGGTQVDLVLEELAECVASESDIESAYNAKELGVLIQNFVLSLPVRDGNVFLRRYFFTESISTIAKGYRLTENNVTVILHRTRMKLKETLIKEGYFYE